MTPEQIQSKLDELYSNPKTKNHVNHLVRSYIPNHKLNKVEETPNKEFKCTITKIDLISYEDWLKTNDSLNGNPSLKLTVVDLMDNNELALTGRDTNTYMSYSTYKEFYKWVVNKVIAHDKHILWLIGDLKKSEFIAGYKGEEVRTTNNIKNNNKNYVKPVVERATYTLGDFSALQELKNKLK